MEGSDFQVKYEHSLKQREREREIIRKFQIRLRTREGQFQVLRQALGDATIKKLLDSVALPVNNFGKKLNDNILGEGFVDVEDKIRQMENDFSDACNKIEELSDNKNELLNDIDKLEDDILESQKNLLNVQKENKCYQNFVQSVQKGNIKNVTDIWQFITIIFSS